MTDRPVPTGPAAPDLTIVETRVYRGPNIWSYGPASPPGRRPRLAGGVPDRPLPGFTDRLLEWLPGVGEHSCSRGRKGGFAERLREGTWVGHVAEHVALQLQNEVGHDTRRGKTRSTGEPGRYHVIYGYQDESVALAAGRLAVRMVNDLVAARPGVRLRRRVRGVPPARRAHRVRAVDPGARRRGGLARHPLDAAEQRLAGAARPGLLRPADPGHHDVEHLGAGRGHRQRQGHDQQAAERRRPAGAHQRVGAHAARGPAGRPAGSATRWSSSRWTATTAAASCSTSPTTRSSRPPTTWPRRSHAAATCRWRASSPATTTASWWSAGGSPPSPSGSRRT